MKYTLSCKKKCCPVLERIGPGSWKLSDPDFPEQGEVLLSSDNLEALFNSEEILSWVQKDKGSA